MELSIFAQLAGVLAVAAGVSVIMRLFKQPLIIGYIISGIICGPAGFDLLHASAAFESFSQIGIALLLFIVGLGLNVGVIKRTGKPVVVIFVLNTLLVGTAGFMVGKVFGLNTQEAGLLALGSLFSSTIVVIKHLVDTREQDRLYAQVAIGVLLMEDLAATLSLVFLTASKNGAAAGQLYALFGKGILLAAGLTFVGWFVMNRLAKFFAGNQEFLFTFTLAWAFSVAAVFELTGFSLEVGALFAGVALASLPYAQEMSTRLKPLRDFFLLLFFIKLGSGMTLDGMQAALLPALALSGVALFVKPLSVSTGMGLLGFTKQTGFKAAAHLSQISEFSVIMMALAVSLGLASDYVMNILTLTTLLTIAASSYLMKYDDKLFTRFSKLLNIFEKRNIVHAEHGHAPTYKLMLFGYRRGGHEFIETFRHMRKKYVVVDYDPDVIDMLERQHITHIYGDATDYGLLEELNIAGVETMVSILPDHGTNLQLLKYYVKQNPKGIFICHATDYDQASQLYELGASYVMLPHFIGSEKMSAFLRKNGTSREAFEQYRKRHLQRLGNLALG